MSSIFNPIAGIGVTPITPFRDPAEKKFTSAEIKQVIVDRLTAEPELVQNQFNIVTKDESGKMTTEFWPALLDVDQWERLSTHRPDTDENGEKLHGTDREVREYENTYWMDNRKHMVITVTTEFGEVINFQVVARW